MKDTERPFPALLADKKNPDLNGMGMARLVTSAVVGDGKRGLFLVCWIGDVLWPLGACKVKTVVPSGELFHGKGQKCSL